MLRCSVIREATWTWIDGWIEAEKGKSVRRVEAGKKKPLTTSKGTLISQDVDRVSAFPILSIGKSGYLEATERGGGVPPILRFYVSSSTPVPRSSSSCYILVKFIPEIHGQNERGK